jgi:hypothetical protein
MPPDGGGDVENPHFVKTNCAALKTAYGDFSRCSICFSSSHRTRFAGLRREPCLPCQERMRLFIGVREKAQARGKRGAGQESLPRELQNCIRSNPSPIVPAVILLPQSGGRRTLYVNPTQKASASHRTAAAKRQQRQSSSTGSNPENLSRIVPKRRSAAPSPTPVS